MEVGYKRYKISDLAEGNHFFTFYRDGIEIVTHTADIRGCCGDSILLKYLDSNGMYRFFPFNEKWEKRISTQSKGDVSQFVTSIETSQSDRKNIGKDVETRIDLTATNVQPNDLEILADLYTSPRVYIYDNSGNDTSKNWLLVQLSDTGTVRRRKKNPQNVDITINLPKSYAVTQI